MSSKLNSHFEARQQGLPCTSR